MMKIIKIRHLLGTLVLAGMLILFSGCTKIPETNSTPIETKVSLTLTLPSPTTLSSYGIDDDRENEVVRLDVFFLNDAGNVINNVGHQTIRSFGQSAGTITASLAIDRSVAQQQLYVIANATDALLDGITTKSQLDVLEFQSSRMPRQMILMSARDILRPVSDFASGISLQLTRSVARMDIKLSSSVNNFKIKSVRVINAQSHSYAYQQLDADDKVEAPASSAMLSYDKVDLTAGEERGFASRLYAFENYNADSKAAAKTTSIILGGEYNGSGTTTFYLIDVKDKDGLLQILRNNRYEITINQVDGPGFTDEDDAQIGASANLRYSIEVWMQSDVDVEFDGTLFLSVSERQLQLPRDAFGGMLLVKTNASSFRVSSPVDASNRPATWLTVKADGDNITYSIPVNSSGTSRTAYFYVTASSKLKIKVSATQVYGDASILKLSTTSVAVPFLGTGVAPATTLITHGRSNITWTIDPTITKFGDISNWVRFLTGQQMTATGTNSQTDLWELKVVADPMDASTTSRSAIVKIEVKDNVSGIVEHYKFTVAQLNNSVAEIKPARLYLGAMGNGAAISLPIKANCDWTAQFYQGDRATATLYTGSTPGWFAFASDATGATLLPFQDSGDGKTQNTYKSSGDDVLHIRFVNNLQGTNKVYNGYLELTSSDGSLICRVRLHHGDYNAVEVNGITMLDRNLGATNPGPADRTTAFGTTPASAAIGYRYQWGRVPDGYEVVSTAIPAAMPSNYSNSTPQVPTFLPSYVGSTNDQFYQWGKLIGGSNSWLRVTSSTPPELIEPMRFWDAAANVDTNSANIENTNQTGVRTDFDPCPDGWRVPTAKELRQIFLSTRADAPNYSPISDFVTNQYGRWILESRVAAPLDIYFPASGAVIWRELYVFNAPISTAIIANYGSALEEGYYASSSPAGSRDRLHYLFFNKTVVEMRNGRHPATGASLVTGVMAIRCIKDN